MPAATRRAALAREALSQSSTRAQPRLRDLLEVDRAGGVAQHGARQPAGAAHRVFDDGPAAHRLADQVESGQRQLVDERGQVIGKIGRIGAAPGHRRRREATVRKGHAGMGGGEVADLLPPRHLVAAQAVGKNDRRSAAGDFVVDFAVGPDQAADAPHGRLKGLGKGHRMRS
jgi:hypothetical protein